MVFLVEAGPD